ncbi:hypothetical protein KKR91_01320 [Arthrobacter jiangjiafuii]|uniref:Uncharacterized protein n=1 Tax=Arthrobacter jiangjiafuii TaxID=2817475 RepID=A0A975R1C9_9MICC|nr:hypothetical protein [Arthrobacter jiangjiafuii]MBP3044852.1 hypothetical protein [Arthrobacter jiangjiafuii]QWC10324.1 hypothetical protein KKR91_01320 [Arthrobacter jiangjiafuii]
MSNTDLIAEARRNAPFSEDESLIMRLVNALEAKPTIGYVVVNKYNVPLMVNFPSRAAAEDYARESGALVSQHFRVAEITDPTR